MKVTGWLHQFDQQPAGSIVDQVGGLGVDRLAVKAVDGDVWMAAYDKSTSAIAGPGDLSRLESALGGVGVELDVWVNVTSATFPGAVAEWQAILDAMRGRLILDLEPYVGFWGDDSDVSAVARSLVGSLGRYRSRLGVTFDPRRADWLGLDAVMGAVSWAMPQVYQADWLASVESLAGRWGAVWEPMVSVSESVPEWLSVVLSARLRANSFGVWLLPVADASQRELLALLHAAGGTQGVPAGGGGQPPASIAQAPPAGVDADFSQYAPKSGTWREACENLKGIADDALEAGRKVSAAAKLAGELWGGR